jgi:hypothetical protein
MKRLTFTVCLSLALLASLAIADDYSRDLSRQTQRIPFDARGANTSMLSGGPVSAGKAAAETTYIMGGPALPSGKFQTTAGLADAQGWTGYDATDMTATWHISNYNCANLDPITDNLAMWCGEVFAGDCGGGDTPEGYDNNYNLWLDWYGQVPNNTLSTMVTVRAIFNSNSEVRYDYLILQVEKLGVMEEASKQAVFDGVLVAEEVDVIFTVDADSYVGDNLDQVHLRWLGYSDTGWSDGDCFWPSNGLAQIDNIEVLFGERHKEVRQTYDTFQPGAPQSWFNVKPPFVGDFHKVWPLLGDADECASNITPQMAFIDDGLVVPGTGGTPCGTWNYGPGGWGVTTTGGLAGDLYGINNDVLSPVMAWPTGVSGGLDGANFMWDVYAHLPIDNGLFYQWGIRTSLDGGLTWPGGWKDLNTVYYGGALAEYYRTGYGVTALLNSGRNAVQISLGVTEPWLLDYLSNDNTPSPYFDNVALLAYSFGGPALSVTGAWSLFNDGWPEISEINYEDLTQNSVRVDIAGNIASPATGLNDPGDSVVVTVKAVRTGAALTGRPTMHVLMKINPLFDSTCRTAIPAGFTQVGDIISGTVLGDTVWTATVPPVRLPNLYQWDLPDTGFFFPGDMFHYYFRAEDSVDGVVGLSHMPRDTTGFSYFPGDKHYDSGRYYELWKIDALPTMITAEKDVGQPHVLFWDDSQDRGNQDEWFAALDNLGYRQGIDYDIYCNAGPSSGLGNGLGGRTNALKMSGYNTMLYSTGELGSFTLCNGDPAGDPGNDIGVVDSWLSQGGKSMFATGDNIIQDLSASGVNAVAFRDKWFGVAYNSFDIRPLIGGQLAPRVSPITVAGAPVLTKPYITQGGCDEGINDFDAITAVAPAVRIAEFLSSSGAPMPAVTYAAAIYNNVTVNTARVVFMPYDLAYIWNGTPTGGVAVRTSILQDVLSFFGNLPGGAAVGVTPDAGVFSARNFPNPFNPSTKIEFNLPVKSQVELKIYNVRGELVKTLLNESRVAGTQSVVWDGRNSTGQAVSSGVYFYSLKAGSYEKMEKMTLVK